MIVKLELQTLKPKNRTVLKLCNLVKVNVEVLKVKLSLRGLERKLLVEVRAKSKRVGARLKLDRVVTVLG